MTITESEIFYKQDIEKYEIEKNKEIINNMLESERKAELTKKAKKKKGWWRKH